MLWLDPDNIALGFHAGHDVYELLSYHHILAKRESIVIKILFLSKYMMEI